MYTNQEFNQIKSEIDEATKSEGLKPRPIFQTTKEIYTKVLKFYEVESLKEIDGFSVEHLEGFGNVGVAKKDLKRMLENHEYGLNNPKPKKRKSYSSGAPKKSINYAEKVLTYRNAE